VSRRAHQLLTVLGVTFGFAVTVGNMIGAGIFRSPGDIAEQLPTPALFFAVWLIGGAYAILGANALAELGTLVPRSGGQYVFVREALGDYGGFVVGWSDWISTCGTTAAVAIAFGEYALPLWPQFHDVKVIALAVIALLTLVQWVGVRWGGFAQDATSFAKGAGFLLLIGACFWLGARSPIAGGIVADHEGSLLVAFILALQLVIYTYDGWSAVIYFSEEVKEPGRSIPRSMFSGVIAVMAIYILLNVAMLRVVPLGTIAGQKLPVAVVAHHLFGFGGDSVTRWLAIAALLGAINSNVMMAPRVLFAMSRDGLFWRGASEVNRGGTPDVALLLSSLIAALFVVWGGFERVVAVLAFFFVANYTLSFTSLFVLRKRRPDAERPFRALGHPVTTGLALLASVAFLAGAVAGDLKTSAWALVTLAVSFPVYLLVRRR
jgi:APA family basic amino acid/polyamine antiporter